MPISFYDLSEDVQCFFFSQAVGVSLDVVGEGASFQDFGD
jgi:hypothetical protein